MKNKIMNVIITLLVICFLIVSCDFRSIEDEFRRKDENMFGELVVNNQSSVNIKNIKYCTKELLYSGESTVGDSSVLPIGRKISTELYDEETGYVFFKLLDKKSDVMAEVRTNEIFTVEKGKRVILTITDNTLVVATGKNEPSTLLDLVTPAILKVVNNSSVKLDKVEYKEKVFITSHVYNVLYSGESVTQEFYDVNNHIGYVYIRKYWSRFQIENEVSIEKGKTTTLTITDDTFVLRNGKVKTRIKLSEIKEYGFVVINNTSYDLYDVQFSKSNDILDNKDILEKFNSWYAGFDGDDGYGMSLYFKIKTSNSEKIFRLDSKCYIDKTKNIQEILLIDDTPVEHEGRTAKLKVFLE